MHSVKRKQRQVALIVLAAATQAFVLASETRAERLAIKSYSIAEGLPEGGVTGIMQDSQGFVWFCTVLGISRFDGYGFTSYGTKDGLSFSAIYEMIETPPGIYWIATNGGGVCRFNPRSEPPTSSRTGSSSRFTAYRIGDEAATNRVNTVYRDREGRLWAGTDGGLFVLDNGKDDFVRVEFGIEGQRDRSVLVRTLVQDHEGSLWIGTTAGLTRRLPDGRSLNYRVQFGEGGNTVYALLEDSNERLWVGTSRGLLVLRPEPLSGIEQKKAPWKRLIRSAIGRSEPHPLPDAQSDACLYLAADKPGRDDVRALHRSTDGHIWIGVVDGGLVEFDGKAFRRYTTAHGLTDDSIRSVLEDRDGNLWLGSISSGAMKFTRNGFTTYKKEDGLAHNIISSVFENHAGEFLAISGDWGINRFDGDRFTATRLNLPPQISDSAWRAFRSLIQDHAGEWWVATIEGLFRFPKVRRIEYLSKAEPIAHYTKKDGLPEDNLSKLFEDSRGDIWISAFAPGEQVLTRWERASGKFYRYSESDGLLPFNPPWCFIEDKSNTLWIGFRNGGVARYRDGRFRLYAAEDGLPAGTVNNFLLDRAGRLWITIGPGGLFRIDDPQAEEPRFVACRTGEELQSPYASFMAEDYQDRIYITMPRGIERLDPATNRIKQYTFADGLPTGPTYGPYRDRKGVLWFSTNKGLLRLVPETDRPAPPPLMFISGLRIGGEPYPVSDVGQTNLGELELGPSQTQIQIDFFALSLAAGESLQYQYKIQEGDQNWSVPIAARSVNLSLSPGAYRFQVRAISADGTVSRAPGEVSFKILRPVWQRSWFVAIACFLSALTAYAVYRYRVNRLVELERVRTRIATDLHDDIGSSLSQIAVLTEVIHRRQGKDSQVAEPLSLIADLSRGLVDSMSDIVWAINPERDRMSDLVHRMRRFASDVLAQRDIEFSFNAREPAHDKRLASDKRREVFLVFKECVNNVVRHSGCTEAEIDFSIDEGMLDLRVRDNGRGFDPLSAGDGNGLASMRKRAAKMGGTFDVISEKGSGTVIRLRAPLQ